MRQHLVRTRQVEGEIRTELLRRCENGSPVTSTERVLIDLLDVRVRTLDRMIEQLEAEATTPLYEAATRVFEHFDKDHKSPYRAFRGATPVDVPSLPKDVAILFEALVAAGLYNGPCPALDPRWNPLPEPVT